ncbi:hypothetical protein M2139_001509 [Enterococcus sp. PF1-24]|uniref:hypothetical protein n=1 Tax=unclassified Enterococcus TaxID=2608891 RepID=UPI0024771046|nr:MULTISPECIES: hypothetical protein [unclassified Enterococcus]MDH6364500.1 hypothetical protein [Enterococcus sp. PFB1-1]MDH6401623.1 hypothetical protein [Enterococcus sp. PF1-24]
MIVISIFLTVFAFTGYVLSNGEERLTENDHGQKYIYTLIIDERYHVELFSTRDNLELEHIMTYLTKESKYFCFEFEGYSVRILKTEIKTLRFKKRTRDSTSDNNKQKVIEENKEIESEIKQVKKFRNKSFFSRLVSFDLPDRYFLDKLGSIFLLLFNLFGIYSQHKIFSEQRNFLTDGALLISLIVIIKFFISIHTNKNIDKEIKKRIS